jgi:hypothetical protein
LSHFWVLIEFEIGQLTTRGKVKSSWLTSDSMTLFHRSSVSGFLPFILAHPRRGRPTNQLSESDSAGHLWYSAYVPELGQKIEPPSLLGFYGCEESVKKKKCRKHVEAEPCVTHSHTQHTHRREHICLLHNTRDRTKSLTHAEQGTYDWATLLSLYAPIPHPQPCLASMSYYL